jgi:hypothetical protein
MKRKHGVTLRILSFFLLMSLILLFSAFAEEGFTPLPGPGKKCRINDQYHFKYSFDKKPQLGTVILKIVVFDQDDRQTTGLKIFGDCGMPSMKGHHDTGDVAFKLNKKGDYLLPADLVMPGIWEIKITFIENEKPVYRGVISLEL